MKTMVEQEIKRHLQTVEKLLHTLSDDIAQGCETVQNTLANNHKILLIGNGGSAADAQHIATEMICRYKTTRPALPAIALENNGALLTAIGNDLGFGNIFSRQIEALAQKGDLLIAISTGGESENILAAIQTAKKLGCSTLGLGGKNGGKMQTLCDHTIIVPSDDTPRIQEAHTLIGHIFAEAVDDLYR